MSVLAGFVAWVGIALFAAGVLLLVAAFTGKGGDDRPW